MAQLEVTQSQFRASAARMVSVVSDYLAQLQNVRAYPQVTGPQTLAAFQEPAPEQGMREAACPEARATSWSHTAGPRLRSTSRTST